MCKRSHALVIILQQGFHHVLKGKGPVQGDKDSFLPLRHTPAPAPHSSVAKMSILFSVLKSKIWRVDLVESVSKVNKFPSRSHRRKQKKSAFRANLSFFPISSAPYLQVPKFCSQPDLCQRLEGEGDRCHPKLQGNSKTQELCQALTSLIGAGWSQVFAEHHKVYSPKGL